MEPYPLTTCLPVSNLSGYGPTGASNSSESGFEGYTAYSTALSVTIAIGCSLLILNVLIFAGMYRVYECRFFWKPILTAKSPSLGVYYQRDKTRHEVKSLQKQYQQRSSHQQSFDSIKHAHYHLGQTVVDVENDTGALMEKSPHICSNSMQINVMKNNSPAQSTKVPMANNTTYKPRAEHVTIPIKNQPQQPAPPQQQQQQQQTFGRTETSFNNSGMMTLPKQNVHIPMSYARNECMTMATLPRNSNLNNSAGN